MRGRRGFTFIELMIYMTIFLAVSGIFSYVFLVFTRTESQQIAESELGNQFNFILQKIERLIASPETAAIIVNSGGAPQDSDRSPGTTLILRRRDPAEDPTKIYIPANNTHIVIDRNGTVENITTDRVIAASLTFTKYVNYPAHDVVQINLGLTFNAAAPNNITRALTAAVGRASAAVFDDSIYPGNTAYSVGTAASKWGDGYFAGLVRSDKGFQLKTSGTRPDCSDSVNQGRLWLQPGAVGGASPTADKLYLCVKDAGDVYDWHEVNIL